MRKYSLHEQTGVSGFRSKKGGNEAIRCTPRGRKNLICFFQGKKKQERKGGEEAELSLGVTFISIWVKEEGERDGENLLLIRFFKSLPFLLLLSRPSLYSPPSLFPPMFSLKLCR